MINNFKDLYPVNFCCQALNINRSSYYYWLNHTQSQDQIKTTEETRLREEIEKIILKYSGYGYRRVSKQLNKQGFTINHKPVNHKRVLTIMRNHSLLCKLKRKWLATTDSNHKLPTYPNLLKEQNFIPTDVNQLWVADITYIKLLTEFVYLATILDAYSRKVIGYCLSDSLDHRLALTALTMALKDRNIKDANNALFHHSDQGVQYCCQDYVTTLKAHNIKISMSTKGAPWENSLAESFFKTLKQEEVYLNEYADIYQAKINIFNFIKKVYNQKRLHSSLNYQPPNEFEYSLTLKTNHQTSIIAV